MRVACHRARLVFLNRDRSGSRASTTTSIDRSARFHPNATVAAASSSQRSSVVHQKAFPFWPLAPGTVTLVPSTSARHTVTRSWGYARDDAGTISSTAGPSVNVFKNANGGASLIWDAMLHVMPWELYNRYADTFGLRTAYDAMKLYLDVTMEKWRKAPDYTPPSGSTEM